MRRLGVRGVVGEELEGVGCKGGGWWRNLRGLGVRGGDGGGT